VDKSGAFFFSHTKSLSSVKSSNFFLLFSNSLEIYIYMEEILKTICFYYIFSNTAGGRGEGGEGG